MARVKAEARNAMHGVNRQQSIAHADAPMRAVIGRMDPRFTRSVVEQALESRDQASRPARDALARALRDNVSVHGFRDSNRAGTNQLCGPASTAIEGGNDELGGALLRVWAERQKPLRARVSEYLRRVDIAPIQPDYKQQRFQRTWPVEEWLHHRDAVVAEHPGSDAQETGLMLCMVAGRAPAPKLEEALAAIESPLFKSWIEELANTPPEWAHWTELDQFIAASTEVARDKQRQQVANQNRAIADAINRIKENHEDDIKYLGLDFTHWLQDTEHRPDTIPSALDILAAMERELAAYQPVRQQAASLAEEKKRSELRGQREDQILKLPQQWRQLMATPKPLTEVTDDRPAFNIDEPPPSFAKEREALRAELDKLRDQHEALAISHNQANATANEQSERISALELEKTQLAEQKDQLRVQLSQSSHAEKYWRQEYIDHKGRVDADVSSQLRPVNNITEAIAQATNIFGTELLFAPNSKSRTDNPFLKPQEVFDALLWLATEFRRLRIDPGTNHDFNRSIKEACPGWFYKANQTQATMGRYTEWYETTAEGRTYELANHIGKGTSHDPRSTIRIAFAWDEEREQVVVGFIGLHQRNRLS